MNTQKNRNRNGFCESFLAPFDFFETIFENFDKALVNFPALEYSYEFSTFPPSNVYLKEDRTLDFEFVVAGYNEDNIKIEFDGDYMVLNLKSSQEDKKEENGKFILRNIKKSNSASKYYVPSDKYDRENAKASLKNGILKVSIPS